MQQPLRKINIAFLIRSLDCGGAERHLVTLVKTLDKQAFEVTVITFYEGGKFESELLSHRIRVVCLRKIGRFEIVGFLWRLVRELRQVKPAIIYSYLVEPNVIAVLLKAVLPRLKVVWSIQATDMRTRQDDRFQRLTFRLQCILSGFANLIIATSPAGRAHHISCGFHESKFIVIKNGVDTDHFTIDRESGQRVRSAWGVPDEMILVGLVARLDPVKDHPNFLKACRLIKDRNHIRFVCVGKGNSDYETSLRQLSTRFGISDHVIWAGARDDMSAVYNSLDISCSSSISEGLPNAIAEAMACGVPCVVTDVGDSALVVGETGIVVPPNDPDALARGLLQCLDNLTLLHQQKVRERINESFALRNFVQATEDAFRALT